MTKELARFFGFCLFIFGIIMSLLAFGCSARKTRPTQLRVHPTDWVSRHSSFIFTNALQAEYGLACQSCHGTDYAGGTSGVSCVGCHNQRQDVCIGCHGGNRDSAGMPRDFTGAPPASLTGRKDDTARGVGGHLVMVNGRSLFTGTDCQTCHIKPAFVLASTHFTPFGAEADGRAEVVFSGLAQVFSSRYGFSTFDTLTGTCANVYCHGAFPGGDTARVVNFYGGSPEAFCGSCHEFSSNYAALGGRHYKHNPDSLGLPCITCHFSTVDSGNSIRLAFGKHVNGVFDVVFDPSVDTLGIGLFNGVSCSGLPDSPTCHASPRTW